MGELEALRACWDADQRVATVRSQIEAIEKAVEKLKQDETATLAERAGVDAQLAANRKAQNELEKRIEEYEIRKRGAMRSLEQGIGDSSAAERQISQVNAILDEAETATLEAMEQRDGLNARRKALDGALATLAGERAERERIAGIEIPAYRERLATAEAEREVALSALKPFDAGLRARWEAMALKKKSAGAFVINGTCHACQKAAPLLMVTELKKGRPATCPGCFRWLFLA